MQILFWCVILVLILIVCYQFLPTVQIYVDDKWKKMTSNVKLFKNFVDDKDFDVPDEMQPKGSVKEFYQEKDLSSHEWGNHSKDGPDRSMPGHCWWVNGCLACKSHPSA